MMKFNEPGSHMEPTPTLTAAPPAPPSPVHSPRRRWPWVAAAGAVVVAAGGFGQAHLRDSASATTPLSAAAATTPAPEVSTVRPVRKTIRKVIEQPGRVEGYEQTPIFVKIPGFVQEWKVDIGHRVTAGQVLAELSVPEEREELKRREANADLARAEITAAERSLDAARADVAKAEAVVRQANATQARTDAALTRWKAEFTRTERLRVSGASSQQEFDAAQDSYRSAEAAWREAEAGIESAVAARQSAEANRVRAEANVTVSRAKLAVAEADARRQAEWLKYATVTAPFTGVVAQRNVDRGQYVMPPASGVNQAPLFVVVRTDPVRVFVDVPETEASLVADGMPVTIRIQAKEDMEIPGTVTRSSWALDLSTRTLRVQIDLPNLTGHLRPGMFAAAKFVLERPGAWVVPTGAVVTTDEQPYAVRVENGKTIKTAVKLGARQAGMVELLQKQTRPALRGESTPWESVTGTEDFLTARPAGWSDGMAVATTAAAK
ncbi:efflux RND transporter periplasmic adaptor subunit [Fimbriiglobus ruber]|uniref:Putative RND efflux membrane fusion protein n=1 Tax=Fimbriiglobus ruber TaxID=1908690 RepID=A0A225DBS3_9BACT|nr:efflux RND transporter periplasmic adaptor subunit [Fimbriiglobus ruber]OWK34599.1 putative RND efflux membrane fusion protein [Fimbriiglobus ruber]